MESLIAVLQIKECAKDFSGKDELTIKIFSKERRTVGYPVPSTFLGRGWIHGCTVADDLNT